MHPIICLTQKDTQHKVFIIPNEDSLNNYAQKFSIDKSISGGIEVFKSLMPQSLKEEITPSYLQSNSVQLYSLEVSNIIEAIKDFENRTLLTPSHYDTYLLMNSVSIQDIEPRDWNAINEVVSINRQTITIKPTLH